VTVWGAPRLPPNMLPRPELVETLESPVPLVLVHGPAGAGKTSLLAEWSNETSQRGVWIHLETPGMTGAACVTLIADELAAAGMLGDANPLRLAETAMMGGAEEWSILRRGMLALDHDIVLVVDRAEMLDPAALAALVGVLPRIRNLRLMLSTRRITVVDTTDPALATERAVIGWQDLAFTRGDVRAVLGPAEPDALVDEVVRWGGSPLLARALAVARPSEEDVSRRVAQAIATYESYLWSNADEPQNDESYRSFLLNISVADVVDLELARALSGAPDADTLLERAERDGLGLWHDAGEQRLFTITPLLRETFLRELATTDRSALRPLRRRVAEWSHAHGRAFEALDFAVRARDLAFASAVVRESWFLLLRSHAPQVIEVFSKTPLMALRQYPLLAMLLALIFNARKEHRVRAIELFGLAIASSRITGSRAEPPDRVLFRTIESASLRVLGSFDSSLAAAQDAYDTITTLSLEDRALLGRLPPVLYNHIGTSFFYSGRMDQAMASFRQSASIGAAEGLPSGLEGLALEAGAAAITGDMVTAEERAADAAGRDWPDGWITGYMGSFYQIAQAFIALERFDADAAEGHVRSLDRHRATIEHWPLLAHLDALVSLLRGDPENALLAFEREVAAHTKRSALGPFTAARLRASRSLLHLAAGDAEAAESSLAPPGRRARRDAVALARIALARGSLDEMLELLGQHGGDGDRTPRVEGEIIVLRAAALVARRDDAGAAVTVRAATFLRHHHQRFAFALIPETHQQALLPSMLGVDPEMAGAPSIVPSAPARPPLTSREEAVAEQLVLSASVSDIARALHVSPNTVKSQLRTLYRKLGVSSRADAIAVLNRRPHRGPRATSSRPA
jgi:LuxR family maltose regulon positive regulatory protein